MTGELKPGSNPAAGTAHIFDFCFCHFFLFPFSNLRTSSSTSLQQTILRGPQGASTANCNMYKNCPLSKHVGSEKGMIRVGGTLESWFWAASPAAHGSSPAPSESIGEISGRELGNCISKCSKRSDHTMLLHRCPALRVTTGPATNWPNCLNP